MPSDPPRALKRAVILAGGKGTRLRPYTTVFPKPLVPIGELPILEIILRQLITYGFESVTLTVGYLAELIRAYLDQRPELTSRLSIDYHTEREPSGTAGSLAAIGDFGHDETLLVMNGDVLTNLDLADMLEQHVRTGASLTIATAHKPVHIDLGVLTTDDSSRVIGYREKPTLEYDVSMGVYLFERQVIDHIVPGVYLDFPDLVLRLLSCGENVCAFRSDALWLDIGRHEDYDRAVAVFESHRSEFLPSIQRQMRRPIERQTVEA